MSQAETSRGAGEGASPETAVRAYLVFLSDPSSLRDQVTIGRLRDELAAATDPIEKLRLLTAIERAEAVDEEGVKLGFLLHAKEWADSAGISASAFRALGVPEDVLVAAGFGIGAGSARRGRAPGSSRPAVARKERRPRAAAVPQGEIAAVALGLGEPFTLAQLVERTGSSPATVKKAVDGLLADGALVPLGPDPAHHGRGRAPGRFGRPG